MGISRDDIFTVNTAIESNLCPGCNKPFTKDIQLQAKIYKVPFYCEFCGQIKFNYNAQWDYVFIWPIPLEKSFVKKGKIIRPDYLIDEEDETYGRSDYGIVLSCGKGYWNKKNKFCPTHGLKVGMKVIYDKFVPTRIKEVGNDGKKHLVVICGFGDVRGIVE